MIVYTEGDVTSPIGDGQKLIPHIVNDIGAWGSGVVVAISRRWSAPETAYRRWYKNKINMDGIKEFKLGNVDFVQASEEITIANMIGQRGIGPKSLNIDGHTVVEQPIRYDALRSCMIQVRRFIADRPISIHAPKFGTLRAGGDWSVIEQMINEEWSRLNVTIYEYVEK